MSQADRGRALGSQDDARAAPEEALEQINLRLRAELDESQHQLERTRAELADSAKKAAIGLKVVMLAHDLNNSINFMTNGVDFLRHYTRDLGELLDTYADLESQLGERERALLASFKETIRLDYIRKDTPKVLDAIYEGAQRSRALVQGLLAYVRGTSVVPFAPCDLGRALEQAVALFGREHESRIEFIVECESVPPIECQGDRIRQVIDNLVSNAIHAIPDRGRVWLGLKPAEDGASVLLSVRDEGTGISSEVLDRIFEPFFTTKPPGVGTGLGLCIVRQVVDEHGGQIRLRSRPSAGTTVEVALPISREGRG